MTNKVIRNIQVVTAEFVAIKQQITQMMLNSAIEMGRRLCEAKLMLNHGEWGKWLREEADISQATANNLMRVFEEYGAAQGSLFGAEANSQTLGNLTYSKAVALLSIPAEERENFAETVDAENLSTRELQRAIKERNDAIEAKEKAEREAEAKEKAEQETKAKLQELEEAIQGFEREKAELSAELEELRSAEPEALVPGGPDQTVIDAAVKEAAEAARKETEEKLKKKIAKAEEAKSKAEAAKLKAEQELNAQKANYEKNVTEAVAAAEREKKILAGQMEELQKKLVISASPEITTFKLHFESVQTSINKMIECMDKISEEESRTKLSDALKMLCATVMENLQEGKNED